MRQITQGQELSKTDWTVVISSTITMSLSFVGIIWLFFKLYYRIKRSLDFNITFQLIIVLCLSDLLIIITNMTNYIILFFDTDYQEIDYPYLCRIDTFLTVIGTINSMFCTFLINLYIFEAITKDQIFNTNKYIIMIALTFILSTFMGIAILISNQIMPNPPVQQANCYMDLDKPVGFFIQTFIGILFIFVLIFQIFTIIAMYRKYQRVLNTHELEHIKNLKKIVYFPIGFVVCWLFFIVSEFCTWNDKQECINVASSLYQPLVGLNGFVNAVLYGYMTLRNNESRKVMSDYYNSMQEQQLSIQGSQVKEDKSFINQ